MHPLRLGVTAVLSACLLAACSTDPSLAEDDAAPVDAAAPAADETSTTYPLTVENCGVEITLDAPPERILASYDVAHPLVLWGLSDKIVGWHTYLAASLYPGLQEQLDELEVEPEPFGREAIVALQPDLVVASSASVLTEEYGMTREQLAEIGAASWVPETLCAQDRPDDSSEEQLDALSNRTFDDVLDELTVLGELVDEQERAATLVAELDTKMAEVSAAADGLEPVRSAMITYYSGEVGGVYVGGIGEDFIARAGGVNPFRDTEEQYKSLSVEELTVNPLDVLLLDTDGGDEAKKEVADLFPTWPAAQEGRVEFVPGLFSDLSGPWVVENLIELFHPDAG